MSERAFDLLPLGRIDVAETAALIDAAFAMYGHLFHGPRTDAEYPHEEVGESASFLRTFFAPFTYSAMATELP
jgi:hypothetical protein